MASFICGCPTTDLKQQAVTGWSQPVYHSSRTRSRVT